MKSYARSHAFILAEARKCLLELGFSKTTIRTLANRLGLSRQTIYRNYSSRDDIIAALYVQEFELLMPEIRGEMKNSDFEGSILKSTLKTIDMIHSNGLMMEIMHGSGIQWFQEQNLDPCSPLYQRLMLVSEELWDEPLDAAREAGLLNPDLSNREVLEWLMGIHYLMIVRRGVPRREQENQIKKFLIPSLVCNL